MNAVAMTAASPASASTMPPRRVLGAYLAEAFTELTRDDTVATLSEAA